MRLFLLPIAGLFACSQLFGQYENASLLVQSQDGKTVKLVWFLKSWNRDITGFDIKRKDGIQDWVKLNAAPILPEIIYSKNLSMVEPDEAEQSAIKDKLYKLLENKKIEETEYDTLLMKLNANDKTLQDLMNLAAHDYDMALMAGFAYVDHSITKKQDYEYGLFINGTNKLLDSVLWNYGQIPDLNAVNEITSKANKKSKGIQIIWNADLGKMRAGDVAGFNIYREGIRLNAAPITAVNSKDISEFTWYDEKANSANLNHYSISAESLFGIEGIIKSYTYNPADHPDSYEMPEVTEVTSLGYYFKEGISAKWTFPKEDEHFIKGFYVEKNNMPTGYSRVSPLLDPSTRAYIDKTSSPVTGYISFKVIAVYNDKTTVDGSEKLYNYFPMRESPQPQNFKATGILEDKAYAIHFSWNHPMHGDTTTESYRIYSCNTTYNKLDLITELSSSSTSFDYTIKKGSAAVYKFCVSSISKNKTESPLSDTVAVSTPSLEMPLPVINKVSLDNNKVVVTWQYPEIADLKGFRLFQNKEEIANEGVLGKGSRKFVTPVLSEGSTYDFSIIAVSDNNVLSDESAPASIFVPAPHKK